MSKKEAERKILGLLYSEEDFVIDESEEPDFLVSHPNKVGSFGVEVTEFFFSESNAHLEKVPHYIDQILTKRKYLHMDDKKNLEVVIAKLTDAEGNLKGNIEGIFQKTPSTEKYSRLIADLIKNKNRKHKTYKKSLDHINLIIHDTEHRLSTIETKHFFKFFFTEELEKCVIKSPYRQVFFITEIKDQRKVYYPLKTLLLLEKLLFFCQDFFRVSLPH